MSRKKKLKLDTGDILSINLDNNEYAFARVLTKVSIGHCIEIFDFIADSQTQYTKVNFQSRLLSPQIIDSYSIFWLRNEGDWDVESTQKDFLPPKDEASKFKYGDKTNLTLIDIFGNQEAMKENDGNRYPSYSPKGDFQIKKIIKFWRDKNSGFD